MTAHVGASTDRDEVNDGREVLPDRTLAKAGELLEIVRKRWDSNSALVGSLGALSPRQRSSILASLRRSMILDIAHDSWLYIAFEIAVWTPTVLLVPSLPIVANHYLYLSINGSAWLWIYGYYLFALWAFKKIAFKFWASTTQSAKQIAIAAVFASYLMASKDSNSEFRAGVEAVIPDLPYDALSYNAAIMAALVLAAASVSQLLDHALSSFAVPAILRRSIGTVSPPQAATLIIIELLSVLADSQNEWLRPATRRHLVATFRSAEREAPRRLLRCAKACGARRDELSAIKIRSWHFGRALLDHRLAIIEATSRADFRQLVDKMARQAADLAAGDWSSVTQDDEPNLSSRIRQLARRITPALLLSLTALGLPLMPGLSADDPSTRGLQVALLVAAALSLVAADPTARDLILGVLRDAAKRGHN